MSIMSMTGRGTATVAGDLAQVEVELSSVNAKALELRIGLPRCLASFESRVQVIVRGQLSRGRISGEVRVNWAESAQTTGARVEMGLARASIAALREAAKSLELPDDLKASVLLTLPGLLVLEHGAQNMDAAWSTVQQAIEEALTHIRAMRQAEGASLASDLLARVVLLRTLTDEIAALAPGVAEAYRVGLLKRLAAALPIPHLMSDERILKEIALFSDKTDVTEELVRLKSHFQQMEELLHAGGVIGRTLDFLVIEIGREINTIGAKANEREITKRVVSVKTELERIREQVQNIE